MTVLILPLCYQARPKPVGRISERSFPRAKFTRQVFSVPSSALPCAGNLVNIRSTPKLSWIPQINARGRPMPSFLETGTTRVWECWYNLSNLTNQRLYQELVYRNGSFKEMITGSAAPALPSFLQLYFRVCAFSIQRTRLSRSLEQARTWTGYISRFLPKQL